MSDKKKILFWGGKSKAKILNNMLSQQGEELRYVYDKFIKELDFDTNAEFSNDKNNLSSIISDSSHFVVCLGSGEFGKGRYLISLELIKRGLKPLSIISEDSIIDPTANVGWGLQTMPGSLLHSYSKLGDACILNSNSSIDHDCLVGNGVHIMGSAAVAGRVEIGDFVSIGTNATILPDIKIGSGAYIGAGALVNKDVEENTIVVGNPARVLKKVKHEYDLSDFNK